MTRTWLAAGLIGGRVINLRNKVGAEGDLQDRSRLRHSAALRVLGGD
jgi:HAMP domain-containing protein